MRGAPTSEIEVSLVSNKGFWLLLDDEELFVPFADFPWFRQATYEQLAAIERPSTEHIYWPQLDVDLAVKSIRDPAAFPLVSKAVAPGVKQG
jgi:hypothetical protein